MAEVSDVLLSLFGEGVGAPALQAAVGPGIVADGRTCNQDLDSGWLELSVKQPTPDGRIHVFSSVVDQVSGDPIFETITLGP
ncbi:MAG: hypothetical protein ABFS37_01585 [Acidobacteriota bacterium]